MYTIEFQTKIEDGTIRVPARYQRRLREQVSEYPGWQNADSKVEVRT